MSKFPVNILEEPTAYYSIDDNSLVAVIKYIEKGLAFAHFKKLLLSIPFSFKEWASFLHISERSLQRYQKSNKAFDASSSEKIVLITMLYNRGASLFGSKENFNAWLYANNIALGHRRPVDFLSTSIGINLLHDELTRIEQGVLA